MGERFNIYCDESCHLENDGISAMAWGALFCPQSEVRCIAEAIRALNVMPSIAANCAIARNAEAARVNQGDLECSSYTWQLERVAYGARISSCQEDSGLTSLFQGCRHAAKPFTNNGLRGHFGVIGNSLTRDGEGDINE